MKKTPLIALLTDFGTQDPFVGVVKGVLHQTSKPLPVVDLSHGVPPQDLRAGAYALLSSVGFFPKGTLFVVVVDPGVGTARSILYVETAEHRFLAPDNGVLSWVLSKEKNIRARRVTNANLFLRPLSATFHGRDIFAPVARAIGEGVAPKDLGPVTKTYYRIPFPQVISAKNKLQGEVLVADRFGNLVTNIPAEPLKGIWSFSVGSQKKILLKKFYGEVPLGKPLAVPGSSGYVELSLRNASAADAWKVRPGAVVRAQKSL